ncbi:efflux RND transporter periplasmic adaptor subunit [Aminithiophilus ramosus]|uniref:Efflux RND transporter periplasmic adaptor subunit n=2 Tax=Synergistales TaxID=649776 RepID=A0A9Q7AB54_9BACT|nr:efflux RND transporter periplasmic adaptor subunit [Aminithiophilus ramosus]QTX31863.1 efflux RND transporter periplasmic adaptor subunit [Aminithiophilus ramosus]QVL35701.1 efflux RND transporter periplasmic adaptor subunit [Synergistota bacterium]
MKKILVLLLLLGAAGGGFLHYRNRPEPAPRYLTAVVGRGDIVQTVSATGKLQAVNTVEVGTQVSGTISELYVDYNASVAKGQLLALIDSTLFEAERAKAAADVAAARASVAEAQANVDDARRTYERRKTLYEKDFIAAADVDSAETTVATTKARLLSARASVAQAEAALRRAETNLGYTRIVSPVDGIVVGKSISAGQTVAASYQTPTLFTIAEDLTKMQVEADVDEADIGYLAEGMSVAFSVDTYPESTFHGHVHQIRLEPSTTENVVTYSTIIHVDNPDMKLKPGMTANVEIEVATARDVLKVSAAALRFSPPEPAEGKKGQGGGQGKGQGKGNGNGTAQGGARLWTTDLRPISVRTGLSDGSFIEVSGDIEEGLEVVTAVIGQSNGDSARPRMPF